MNILDGIKKVKDAVFERSFELSLTKDYVSRWTAIHAIRELIQNALDSESPFVYGFTMDDEGCYTLNLWSEFTVLTPATLLLGSTSKSDRNDAIGSFGEGYKIALLVLSREGYLVEMYNGDVIWQPSFRFSRAFGADILVIEERSASDKQNKGLTIYIHGLSQKIVEEIKDSCLLMQQNIGEIKKTPHGDILLERPGKLYVGSLYICDTYLRYGYNIKPEFIQLERDRQTVSSWDLRRITTRMWYETQEFDHVAKMIQEEADDIVYASWDAPEMIKDACYRVFRRQHPQSIIASSAEQAQKMVEEGLTKVVYVGSTMYAAVSDSSLYKSERQPSIQEKTPVEELQAFYDKWHYNMHAKANEAFRELIKKAKRDKWSK